MYSSPYPIPAITTTAIVCSDTKVLLIKRKQDPFKDKWAFPGGFFNQFESARECCIREVKEETGIDIRYWCPDVPLNVISNKDRDPRGWVIDCPFLINIGEEIPCKGNDDAAEAMWFYHEDVDKIDLAFDHKDTWDIAREFLD
jgi:8-oxo-dGTP diphosphatase